MIFKKALYDPFKFSPHLNMNCSEQIAYTQHAAAVLFFHFVSQDQTRTFCICFWKPIPLCIELMELYLHT